MTVEVCAARVEAGDPDRFAAVMATPAALRARLWPLYAVNLEIARAPWASAEPMIAEMRLQWWVDALDALAQEGREPAHEIGAAMAVLRPVAPALAGIAEARRRDCWREPFADAGALWDYLDGTSGALYAAAGELLGTPAGALRDYGRAAGLAAWFLAVPELESRGVAPLPGDQAGLAGEGLALLDRSWRALPRAARAAALPGWEARQILDRARRTPEKIRGGDLRGSEFSRRFSLLRAVFQA
ncbi:squalene/phytoene synthase family protein [Paenirhodobacter sp.]|uniref:squalene/phytoene synthase family protein n=1 Tax=Paenirhodobacter sp. TaxID=1965326 RepID=UPI003B3BF65F